LEALEHHLQEQIKNSQTFFWHRIRWDLVSRVLPSDRNFSVLDAGAGIGLVGKYLKRDFPRGRYHFIEPLPSLDKYLTDIYGKESNLIGKDSFPGIDFVFLLDVIEHQKDDRQFVHDIIRKMDTGARLVVTVPAFSFFWSDWDRQLGHFRRYSRKSLMAVFATEPVKMERTSTFFPELVPLALYRKIAKKGKKAPSLKEAEFPRLPPFINEPLYCIGRASLPFARWLPLGTSIMTVMRKQAG